MRNILRLFAILAMVALPAAASAQITVPFPAFTAGTTIQPDEVNQNFAKFADACNRTGCTMTGTLTARDIFPDTHNTRDLGLTGTRFRDAFFGRNVDVGGTFGATGAATLGSTLAVTGAGTFTSTLAVNSTSAAALDVAGGITAGSGNVAVIDTTGKIPALNSTYFASTTTSSNWAFTGTVTVGSSGEAFAAVESVTLTWDPASIAVGASTSTLTASMGVATTDTCMAAHTLIGATTGLILFAVPDFANPTSVRVTLFNGTASTQDVGSGTVRVTCIRF